MTHTTTRPDTAAHQHIVILHGMWCTPEALNRIADLYSRKGFTVHTPHLPYHGNPWSSRPCAQLGETSILSYANYLSGFIDSLNLDELPILVGHSLGGLLAQILTARGEASAAVLLSPAPPSGINAIYPTSAWSLRNVFFRWKFWSKPSRLGRKAFFGGMLNCVEEERRKKVYQEMVWDSGRALGQIVFWFLDREHSSVVDPRSVNVPMLVVGAGKDRVVLPSVAQKIAHKYPTAEYLHCPHHGHWLIDEERTDDLVSTTSAWLDSKITPTRMKPTPQPATVEPASTFQPSTVEPSSPEEAPEMIEHLIR